jgi:hypothetical protein
LVLKHGTAAQLIKSSTWFAPAMKWMQMVVFIGIAVAILIPERALLNIDKKEVPLF